MEEINEGCGCTETTNDIRSFSGEVSNKYQDPLVGKRVNLIDGRKGLIDDAIRNQTGEVIGYVIEGEKGNYRVFKNKIKEIDESGAPMASLESTPGQGDVIPPSRENIGSGDVFPTLTAGSPAAAKKEQKREKAKEPNPIDTSIMDFETFLLNTKKNQDKHNGEKKTK